MESWPGTEPEPEPGDDVHFSSKEGLRGGVRQPCSSAGALAGPPTSRGWHGQEPMGRHTGIQRTWVSNCFFWVFIYFSDCQRENGENKTNLLGLL